MSHIRLNFLQKYIMNKYLLFSYENLIDTVHNSKKGELNVKHNNKKASEALSSRIQVTPDLSFLVENFDGRTFTLRKESLSQVCFFGLAAFSVNILCSSYWADLPFYYSRIVGSFWHKTLLSLTSFKHANNSKKSFYIWLEIKLLTENTDKLKAKNILFKF